MHRPQPGRSEAEAQGRAGDTSPTASSSSFTAGQVRLLPEPAQLQVLSPIDQVFTCLTVCSGPHLACATSAPQARHVQEIGHLTAYTLCPTDAACISSKQGHSRSLWIRPGSLSDNS